MADKVVKQPRKYAKHYDGAAECAGSGQWVDVYFRPEDLAPTYAVCRECGQHVMLGKTSA